MVHLLNKNNSIINHFIGEIRNVDVQGDRLRFKRNLERIGEIAALEISKTMEYENVEITTPLGLANVALLKSQPLLATILRAGLPLHQGLLNYFDGADSAFISAYRRHHKDGSFDIHVEYLSAPSIENKVLIIADPMIATGQSLVLTYKALLERGTPKHTHIVAAISSRQGIAYLQSHLPDNVSIWTGAIDEELTSKAYIVPGLGDAGDLAYGAKI
ncbi:MAG: uracil phosphoribosyltransferase [Bacteroidetes bacterium]|nr:uracil phosphoribosyltransferase [Bacteroidota bacterium]MBL0054504.1 uracil phosphoribosyltransferase [Bacteroidota bacterium]